MSSSKIKVSIIIPVYNAEKYLKKCIQSVTKQTLKEIEIFLIDDGSSDKSWKVIQQFAKKDARITAIQQENAGAAVARNQGLALARGEYIGFVDSDDYVDSDYFEQLYKAAKKNKADIARAYVKSEIETGEHYQMNHTTDGYDSFYNVKSKESVLRNKLNLSNSNWLAIYKRSVLTKNKIEFMAGIRTGQDNIFNLHVSYVANKVVFVETPTYYHMVRRDGSLMTGYNFTTEGLISRALVIEETVRFMNSAGNYDEEVYVSRVKDAFDFFHSRLIKTAGIDKRARRAIADILIPTWGKVKYKDGAKRLLRHDARFIESLSDAHALSNYIVYIVPARRALSKAEKRRQALKQKIYQNNTAYKTLRLPVKALRKANRLVAKLLS